jgi:ABC-2 type transport system permease protein
MSGVYISIGLFTSSITYNQIVAFLTALFTGLLFHLIFDLLAGSATGIIGQLFNMLSMRVHFESISRGVIDSSDLIYYLSLIFLGLFFSEVSLAQRNKAN